MKKTIVIIGVSGAGKSYISREIFKSYHSKPIKSISSARTVNGWFYLPEVRMGLWKREKSLIKSLFNTYDVITEMNWNTKSGEYYDFLQDREAEVIILKATPEEIERNIKSRPESFKTSSTKDEIIAKSIRQQEILLLNNEYPSMYSDELFYYICDLIGNEREIGGMIW